MERENEPLEVANSDEERDEALINYKEGIEGDIPLQVLMHFDKIDKEGVLELKVEEFKRDKKPGSSNKQTNVGAEPESSKDNVNEMCKDEEMKEAKNADESEHKHERSPKPSAFDYQEESPEGQGQLPRRTPKSGRVNKRRVGSLQNVISNLRRFRELDNSTADEETTKSALGEESKNIDVETDENKDTIQEKSSSEDVIVEA